MIDGAGDGANFVDDDDDDGDDVSASGSRRVVISVRTAMLDMKSAAVQCIGTLAEKTGTHFSPYIARG